MNVVTIVDGRVPLERTAEFESVYATIKKGMIPPGLLRSYLLRESKDPQAYEIPTIWESQESLDKMRSGNETPAAIAAFQKVGVSPTLAIYLVKDTVP